ncbi:serine carboxypeptidase 1-like [Triticum urartu]|uniref:serine carboxypeptidase 1-like n=1 Tax=Triticum urartu TaxID=4572 RepID=UPI0020434745|nr:serine carboxypeptidase 1-like [Triticum urartu]XP_048574916.1 serine carboxypeptidase 1-like [Triticum urartu]
MKTISSFSLLVLCLAALQLHANASHSQSQSQEAQLKKFISSRKNSATSSDTFRVRNIADRVAGSLSAESTVSDQSSMKAADKITALPGQPEGVDFDQYGGYVTVDAENGRALFYYLVESPSGASDKPLVLWLNGVTLLAYTGPGCSSLGYGAMQELGPFRVTEDNKTLSRNVNAWNNVANVIFLESPAGVGYSYSNTSSDYDLSGDERTADDAYVFLVKWLERFPEYKDRAFYISGESYAGHYVPELAATILLHNTYNNRTVINLQGILVGNPYLDGNQNIKGAVDYFWTHAVMSDEVYANITKNCDFDNLNGTFTDAACMGAAVAFDSGYIDGYNIYAPVCIDAPNGTYYPAGYLPGYDPCSYYPTDAYLNDPAVQMAFHARTTKWSGCANLNWTDGPMSMLPTMKWLIESKLPIWIFSGDFDSVCPLPATRYSIQDMALSVTTPWRPWTAKEEVGGYVQQYAGGFTFLSVRGAGHMVPSFQPERALVMLSSFLQGVLPPYVEQQ